MRKCLLLSLVMLLAFLLVSCGGANPSSASNNGVLPEGFSFAPEGVKLDMGAAPAAALAALGDPLDQWDSPSCAIDAKDITYRYAGFELTITYPEKGDDYIAGARLTDDSYATPEQVTIGSTLEEVTAAYGKDYTEVSGQYTYTKGRSTLQFQFIDGAVSQILYAFLFL